MSKTKTTTLTMRTSLIVYEADIFNCSRQKSETLTPRNLESSWSPPQWPAPAGLSRPLRAVGAAAGGP